MNSVPSICERLEISSDFLAFHKLCNDGPFLVHIDATDGWHRRYCLSTWPLLTARFVTTIHCTKPPLWSLPNLSNSQVQSLGLGKLFPTQHGPWQWSTTDFGNPRCFFQLITAPIGEKCIHNAVLTSASLDSSAPKPVFPWVLTPWTKAGACLLNAVLTKIFIRKQASLQSSHTTRS